MKYLIGIALVLLFWRLYKWRLAERIREETRAGKPPEKQGPRFITIVCAAILLVYGGYTLVYLIRSQL